MYKAFEIAGYGPEVVDAKFGGMIRALKFGAPPHGGIAPGIDRMVMLLCGADNLRDVTHVPAEPAGRRPAHGRAVGGFGEAAARAAHPAEPAEEGVAEGTNLLTYSYLI